ncbi:O-antigen ligase family protein [Phenylobacterium montanum]|uniref:O-antigen ligase family protein n=1 Tax=Phenylobacterium montanum TaxID=2823693 RepID=A0A975IUQ8_9CAUL|nr:O-antigen ligase family protein [Caulobacter sp. S6]QUD86506.1 O-antigen ligase family protein [Caulobacter sp. S6]
MVAIAVLMMSLVAGFFWPGALWAGCFFTYQVASITEIDSISMVYVVLAGGVAVFHALRRPPPFAFGWLDAVFLGFIGAYSLSATYMPDAGAGAAAAGQLWLSAGTMYVIGRLTCWPERLTQTTREMLVTTLIMGSVLALIIFHSRTVTTVRVARLAVGTGSDVGISGPFPFILAGAVASLLYYFNTRQIVRVAIAGLALVIVGYVSVYSATRGVYVSMVGGLGVIWLLGRGRMRFKGVMVAGVLGLCGLIAVIPFMPHTVELQNAVMRLVGNFHGGGVALDPSLIGRMNNYRLATTLFLQHPYFGLGIGGFNYSTGIIYVHNIFLEMACEFGLVGLVLELTYLAILFRSGFQLSRTYPEAASLLLGFIAVHLTHMLVSDTLAHAKILFMFTAVIAGALASLQQRKPAPAPVAVEAAPA